MEQAPTRLSALMARSDLAKMFPRIAEELALAGKEKAEGEEVKTASPPRVTRAVGV